MSRLRKEMRRVRHGANRMCATVAELERLDRDFRKLPTDFPSFVRAVNAAKEKGKELSEAQIDVLLSDVIHVSWAKAQPILWLHPSEQRVQAVGAATCCPSGA